MFRIMINFYFWENDKFKIYVCRNKNFFGEDHLSHITIMLNSPWMQTNTDFPLHYRESWIWLFFLMFIQARHNQNSSPLPQFNYLTSSNVLCAPTFIQNTCVCPCVDFFSKWSNIWWVLVRKEVPLSQWKWS